MTGLSPTVPAAASGEPFGLWGRAFRPFFLLLAIHAALVVPVWTLVWTGAWPPPAWLAPAWWHGHEMVFGFLAAAIAGFLLTAAPVWSGGAVLAGRPLAALVGLWLAGRVAFALAGVIPAWAVAGLDLGFLPGVAWAAARSLRGSGQRRNQALVGIVALLALANAAVHAEALGWVGGAAGPALRLAVDVVVVLLVVIGGRITPAFTRNALRRRGVDATLRSSKALDVLCVGACAALALWTPVAGRSALTGALAALAGIGVAARLAGWRSGQTSSDPLLWSLHAGAAWLVVGLLLVASSDLGAGVPASAGLHALTAGAMASTILAVMTRVGLGHTGRPLVLPRGVSVCYVLVHAAALARVAAPFVGGAAHRGLLLVSGLAWAGAFGLYAARYAPILVAPRADGAPG